MADSSADQMVIARLEDLVAEAGTVLSTFTRPPVVPGELNFPTFGRAAVAGWQARCRAALVDLLGESSSYLGSFDAASTGRTLAMEDDVRSQLGVMASVLLDAKSGYLLQSARRLVSAEVYGDLLEQADGLLANRYDLAAAAVCGAALESGLRTLCRRRGVPVQRKDDISALSTKLTQKGHITAVRRSEIQVWSTVRSKADHGHPEEFGPDDVAKMIAGVQSFLAAEL
jgi:hypothetical protein